MNSAQKFSLRCFFRCGVLCFLAAAVVGCGTTSGKYYKDDGPPTGADIRALSNTPDAVVKEEPISPSLNKPYQALGRSYTPMTRLAPFKQEGYASWYGKRYQGRKTSLGIPYDLYSMVAAHPTLPLPSYIRVTNVANNKSVVVRVIDRGPFSSNRILDVSYAAAVKLGFAEQGTAKVAIELLIPNEQGATTATTLPAPPTVAPATASPLTVVPTPTDTPGLYLQLGAFTREDNASAFSNQIAEKLSWAKERMKMVHSADGYYRLRVGPYANREEALQDAKRIGSAVGREPFIVDNKP